MDPNSKDHIDRSPIEQPELVDHSTMEMKKDDSHPSVQSGLANENDVSNSIVASSNNEEITAVIQESNREKTRTETSDPNEKSSPLSKSQQAWKITKWFLMDQWFLLVMVNISVK